MKETVNWPIPTNLGIVESEEGPKIGIFWSNFVEFRVRKSFSVCTAVLHFGIPLLICIYGNIGTSKQPSRIRNILWLELFCSYDNIFTHRNVERNACIFSSLRKSSVSFRCGTKQS